MPTEPPQADDAPADAPETPSRRRRAWLAMPVGAFAAAAATLALALPASDEPSRAASPTPAAVQPGSPTTPTTQATASSTSPTDPTFPSTDCQPAALAAGSALGIGIPRAARLSAGGPERAVLDAAVACLRGVTGQPTMLRTQVPIDAARRASPSDDERGELATFAQLLATYGAPGIISIRSHDFTRCGRDGAPEARQVDRLPGGRALRSCEFPTPALYARLLAEVKQLVDELAPGADLRWTAWNEPDHPMFTLLDALGGAGAARRAGQYWSRAAVLLGPDRVLAGEFSDREPAALLRLRTAFVGGAGQTPQAWAIHPYRDFTDSASGPSVDEQFAKAVAPAPVWLTEVTARLSGRGGLGGAADDQRARGTWLRDEIARRPVRAVLYLLTPPAPPRVAGGDTWDSAIADRQGRARPFVCGLSGLPIDRCPGDPATYGG